MNAKPYDWKVGMRWVWHLGGLSMKELARRVWAEIDQDDVSGRAAQLSFYFVLALFPLLIFLSAVMGQVFAGNTSVYNDLLSNLRAVMPGSAYNLVRQTVDEITQGASGGKLSLGLIGTLWTASSGMEALMIGLSVAAPLVLLVPASLQTGVIRTDYPEEEWSPYYRINYSPKSRTIVVNLLGHQTMISRNDPFPAYALPYLLNRDAGQPQFRDILIIGAGSGNDLSRALQWAAPDARIDAVEIDPVIQKLGRRDHPDRPYQDPRVTRHLGDGRNFLRSTTRTYDLIVFALIDSLVLHSSVSNIRLESYLFTREAMTDVRNRLKPDGMFVMYNYFRQGWIVSRLTKTLSGVFAHDPLVLMMPERATISAEERADGFTAFFVGARARQIQQAFRERGPYSLASNVAPDPSSPTGFQTGSGTNVLRFTPARVDVPADLRVAEDVWPFLYLRNPMIPDLSWRGLAVIGSISLLLLWRFGWRLGSSQLSSLNTTMLLLGAGFMLLETKAVVHTALIFGSTWTVNTVVFSAMLVMILFSNLWVLRRRPRKLAPFYIGLLLTLGINIAAPLDSFLGLPYVVQGIAAGALVFSPIFCAGVIFATLFESTPMPEQALAYNTAGAILGGLSETTSLLIGFQWILALAALIYAGSWLMARRSEQFRLIA